VTIYGSLEDIPGVRECDCIGKLTVAVANAEAAEALKVEKRDKAAATKAAAKVDAAMQAKAEKLAAKEHAKAEKLAAKEQAKAEKVAADNIKVTQPTRALDRQILDVIHARAHELLSTTPSSLVSPIVARNRLLTSSPPKSMPRRKSSPPKSRPRRRRLQLTTSR